MESDQRPEVIKIITPEGEKKTYKIDRALRDLSETEKAAKFVFPEDQVIKEKYDGEEDYFYGRGKIFLSIKKFFEI